MTGYTKEDAFNELAVMNVCDDFMFSKVMEDKNICRMVLSALLGMDVGELRDINTQDVIKLFYDGRGVRLDVRIINDTNHIFNAEMQQTNRCISKRSRYYQSMMDIDILPPGNESNYDLLNNCYIIFICTFDPFHKGLHKYTFTNICHEIPDFELNDGSFKVFFYTDAAADDVSCGLKELLYYFTHSTNEVANASKNDIIKSLHKKVTYIRTDGAVGGELMTTRMKCAELRAEGRLEGRIEGIADVIMNIYANGYELEQIADMTGKSIEEVKNIVENKEIVMG